LRQRKKTKGNAHQKIICRGGTPPRFLAKRGGVKWSKISRFAQCSDHLGGDFRPNQFFGNDIPQNLSRRGAGRDSSIFSVE
jgi:hypothetical protein